MADCEAARLAVNGIASRMRLAEDRLTGSNTVPGRRRGLPATLSGKGNPNVGQVERISIGCGETPERIAFDQVHLIKGDTHHNQRLTNLGLPSI